VPPIKPATPVKQPEPQKEAPPVKLTLGSKISRFFRKFFRWALIVLDLLAIGAAIAIVLLYVPKRQQLETANANLAQIHQTATAVQSALNQSKQTSQALNQQNVDQAALNKTNDSHLALLQAMNAISSARAALATDDPATAKKELDSAPGPLSTALTNAPVSQNDLAKTIQTRFDLVRGELDRDPTTTASDLKILSDKLSELEVKWFAQ
jgi:multidrug resistance efflux pump